MTFTPQDAKLWDYVMGSAKRLSKLKEIKDDNEDR